jgi:hypothetical protein
MSKPGSKEAYSKALRIPYTISLLRQGELVENFDH